MYKTAYFDMDNTLVATQALYQEARVEFASLLQQQAGITQKEIFDRLTQEEIALFDTYGYGRHMLPHAYENTFLHFKKDATQGEVAYVRKIADSVYSKTAEPKEGAMEAITLLASFMNVCLVTVGDEAVQRKRIEALPCKDAFHKIFVVSKKDAAAYRHILSETSTRPDQAVMVGDSLKSDIIPAVEAGMHAIFIPANNWVAREMVGVKLPEKGAVEIADIKTAAAEICAKVLPPVAPKAIPQKFNA